MTKLPSATEQKALDDAEAAWFEWRDAHKDWPPFEIFRAAYCLGFAVSETGRSTVAPNVDGQDFYELCQAYRHSKEIMPYGMRNTVQAFNDLRYYIKTGALPWPSYERSSGNEESK